MSFDPLARYYSAMEWLLAGRKLQRCRTAFFTEAASARSILLAGEGHGKFLEELCRIPDAVICYVDASVEMTRVARSRIRNKNCASVVFHSVPILSFESKQRFDLISTQFFLDCFEQEELERVIAKLADLLKPAGLWLLADFQVPPHRWRRWRAQAVLAIAYRFFRVVTSLPARHLVAPQPFLRAAGLELQKRKEFNCGLLYAECWRKP